MVRCGGCGCAAAAVAAALDAAAVAAACGVVLPYIAAVRLASREEW